MKRRGQAAALAATISLALVAAGLVWWVVVASQQGTCVPSAPLYDDPHGLADAYAQRARSGTPAAEILPQLAAEWCLVAVGPGQGPALAVGPGDVGVRQAAVFFDTVHDEYVAVGSFTWTNDAYTRQAPSCDDNGTPVGQPDGFGVRIGGALGWADPRASAVFWGKGSVFGPIDVDESNSQLDVNDHGAYYRFQDRCSGSAAGADYTMYGGVVTYRFRPAGSCARATAYDEYDHTWGQAAITNVDISPTGFGLTVAHPDQAKSYQPASAPPPVVICPQGGGPGSGSTPVSVMVMGDSTTQGLEGDYTWRYRLAEHLARSTPAVAFVGPHVGTYRLVSTDGTTEPAVFDGVYHSGVNPDLVHHDSRWGLSVGQAKDEVNQDVTAYHPDFLLLMVGFNDLGYNLNNPDGLISDMGALIANARAARPGIRILIGNVVHRSYLAALPDLDARITNYDNQLAAFLPTVSTSQSPVRLVDLASAYTASADSYDGLHPNSVGEYVIARAFADVLSSQFGIGGAFAAIPTVAEDRTPGGTTVRAQASAAGITLSWAPVFGASGFRIYERDATAGQPFQILPLPVPAIGWTDGLVAPGHRYEFKVQPVHGYQNGPISAPVSAVP
jgi:lysophospholipase L1-like esterase